MSTVLLALAVVVLGLRAGLDGPDTGARAASLPQPPDSEAPPGAPPHWIPSDEWVMQHWLPYDEARLLHLLGIERTTLWRHLRDDRRTISQLAERHGWPDPRALAAALVAPRRGAVGSDKARELESRAVQTLTQGHLAQHILFHSLHQDAVPDRARTIRTPNTDRFQRLRRLDVSPLQIARMNGRSGATVRVQAEASLRERALRGHPGAADRRGFIVIPGGRRDWRSRRATTPVQARTAGLVTSSSSMGGARRVA